MIDEININSTVYRIHFTKETVPESFRDVSDDSEFVFGGLSWKLAARLIRVSCESEVNLRFC